MKFFAQKFLAAAIVLVAMSSQVQAYTCSGGNIWKKLPASTKQQLTARANQQPYASGRFFKIERNGRVSYLLGTVHVPPIKQLKLPAHVMQKVQASKRVYLEKSVKEFDAFSDMLKANPGYYRSNGLNNFSRHFTSKQWAAVRQSLADVGWRKGAAETLRPWFIFDEISGLGCGQDNEGMLLSLDARVMRVAGRYKIPMIGLETPEKVDRHYRALSERDLVDMIKSLPTLDDKFPHGGAGKAMMGMLGNEDIVLTYVFEDYISQSNPHQRGVQLRRDFTDKKILFARNKAWMPALTKAFNAGGSFVAVGAAHLGGRYGLLPMLQRKGYKITRVSIK
ncbi:MAG: hypothetical protein ACI9ZD_000843 [Paracoccaceae bacterium]|jgi:uncharacterized protein YbaP (TraB family)